MFAIPNINELMMQAVAIIPALTFHEYAHAWAAYRAGDETAYRVGRLSLNPLVHLDPLGTIMLFFGPIGWAKPVPVNPANYRNPRRDDIIVSLAGVVTNALSAIVWTLIYALVLWLIVRQASGSAEHTAQTHQFLPVLLKISLWGIMINVALTVFNLIPIPPLDGSHVLGHLLKGQAALRYAQLHRYGPGLLIVFVVINMQVPILWTMIGYIVEPLQQFAETLVAAAL